ncbi:MAG: hypothetical protein KGV51_02245 [Moraxellaceae bacterium]|nr:hypothetical protein [Moraxellaceae bacterium]
MSKSYLEFLNNPTPQNVKFVHKQAKNDFGLTQVTASEILGIGLQTYKGWHADIDNRNYRKPHTTTWNLFLYELEARHLGFENLQDFFKNIGLTQN